MEQVTRPKLRSGAAPQAHRAAYLFLALEAGRSPTASARFCLSDVDAIVVGRGPRLAVQHLLADGERQLHLQVPDPWMSRCHARIRRVGELCILDDEGSSNGSQVNGRRVDHQTLADRDHVELGQTFFVFRTGLPSSSPVADILDAGAGAIGQGTVLPLFEQRLAEVARIAPTQVAVVLFGPSGSGKEVLARAIHARSGRTGPFIAVNCGALPEHLIESELFGHRKGAFSGAIADRVGLIAAAHGGTLFLDEIGDLPLEVQPALLRALQERSIVPIGGAQPVPVDFRLISATHRDLPARVRGGLFREDLWARLGAYALALPPLFDRREDLGTIVADILRRLSPHRERAFTVAAARALLRYSWPRNVRELEKTLEAAIALAGDGDLDLAHLPPAVADGHVASDIVRPAVTTTLPIVESGDDPRRERLIAALREHRGNVSAVARELAKPRSQVQRWMRRWNLRPDDFAGGTHAPD